MTSHSDCAHCVYTRMIATVLRCGNLKADKAKQIVNMSDTCGRFKQRPESSKDKRKVIAGIRPARKETNNVW